MQTESSDEALIVALIFASTWIHMGLGAGFAAVTLTYPLLASCRHSIEKNQKRKFERLQEEVTRLERENRGYREGWLL